MTTAKDVRLAIALHRNKQAELNFPRDKWAPEAIYLGYDDLMGVRNSRDYTRVCPTWPGEGEIDGVPIVLVDRETYFRVV
jgi:hypothetical protein